MKMMMLLMLERTNFQANSTVSVYVAETLIAMRWWHYMSWARKVNPFEIR